MFFLLFVFIVFFGMCCILVCVWYFFTKDTPFCRALDRIYFDGYNTPYGFAQFINNTDACTPTCEWRGLQFQCFPLDINNGICDPACNNIQCSFIFFIFFLFFFCCVCVFLLHIAHNCFVSGLQLLCQWFASGLCVLVGFCSVLVCKFIFFF